MLDSVKIQNKEDFDPQSLVAPIDAHTKDISDLTARIKNEPIRNAIKEMYQRDILCF